MKEYKRILVVVRLIQTCKKAIRYGVSLARKYDAELYVMHTVNDTVGMKGWGLGVHDLVKEYEKSIEDSKQKLADIIADEKGQGFVIQEIVQHGEATAEIMKVIKEKNIDLLVMLSHEEGRFEHFLFGRSNEKLLRKMPCSILMVKKEPGEVVE